MRSVHSPTVFEELIGRTANGCWVGYGSALFLEFGESDKDRLSLWAEWLSWRIELGDGILGGSSDDDATMEIALSRLDGHALLSGELDEATGDSVLRFEDGFVVRAFVATTGEDKGWIVTRGAERGE